MPELTLTVPLLGAYELAAVVYNRSASANVGHYYCAAWGRDGRWWRFDGIAGLRGGPTLICDGYRADDDADRADGGEDAGAE